MGCTIVATLACCEAISSEGRFQAGDKIAKATVFRRLVSSVNVSIVIPTLNEESALADHLPRLQKVAGVHEIVIADGGSTDATRDVALQHNAKLVAAPVGRGRQMNAGARQSQGDVLVFLHADCWLEQNAIVEARSIVSRPDVIAGVFRQQIEAPRRIYRWIEGFASVRAKFLRTPYGDSGLFLRRRFFDAIGGFPEVPLCEDLGIAKRLRRHGRVAVARSRVHLSARRWEERGVLRDVHVKLVGRFDVHSRCFTKSAVSDLLPGIPA